MSQEEEAEEEAPQAAREPFCVERARETLRSRGFKLTPQRLALLKLFAEHDAHLTAPRVITALARRGAPSSRATVYNTLDLLVALGLIARHSAADGSLYYDANTSSHHHAVCTACGEVCDVHVPEAAMSELFAHASGASHRPGTMTGASIWFEHRCASCGPPE